MPSGDMTDVLKLDRFAIHKCSGKTLRAQPCNNTIGKPKRSQADMVLNELVNDPAGRQRTRHLKELSGFLLCHLHQDQSPSLVEPWKERLDARARTPTAGNGARQHTRLPSEARGHSRANTVRDETPQPQTRVTTTRSSGQDAHRTSHANTSSTEPPRRPYTRAYARMLQTITSSSLSPEEKLSMIEMTLTTQGDFNSTEDEEEEQEDRASRTSRSGRNPNRDRSPSRRPTRPNQTANSVTDPSTSAPVRVESAFSRFRATTPARFENAFSSFSITAPASVENVFSAAISDNGPHRESHLECAICQDSYEVDDDYWQCTACDNRTHAECFRSWATSRTLDATCVYCRVAVL